MAQEPGTMTPKIKAAVQVLIHSPSSQNGPSALLTPSTKKSTRMLAPPMPTPQRMHHRIPHRFVNGLNTRATKCAVCLGSVQFVKQAAKCQGQYMQVKLFKTKDVASKQDITFSSIMYEKKNPFLARMDEVQEELLYYPPAMVSALAAAAALAKSLTLKFFM